MVVVSHFLKWLKSARAAERAAAATALARAYVTRDFTFEDRCASEAALTLLLDDPSAAVRRALAEALCYSAKAPAQVIAALAADQPDVAAPVIARSPLLTDPDLIDHVGSGRLSTQRLIAGRPVISKGVCAALAEVGDEQACAAMLCNDGADIAPISFRRIADRFGHVAEIREALIRDARLPAESRHLLLIKLGEALRGAGIVTALMGDARAEKLTHEACVKASLTIIDGTQANDFGALIAHLRLRGELTASFIVRAVAHGKVDFFGAVLVALTEQSEARVRSMLAQGSDVALGATLRSGGLADAVHPILIRALKIWREVAAGKRVAGAQEVSWEMLKMLGGPQAEGNLASLVKSIHLEALRENARGHALAIAAA